MKKIVQIISFVFFLSLITAVNFAFPQSVGIGGISFTPDTSAMLEIRTTNKGLLIPNMTQAQRNSIALPATSLLIFQTDALPGYYYNSGIPSAPVWVRLFSGATGDNIQNQNTVDQTADFRISGSGRLGGNISINGGDINGPGINGGASGIFKLNGNSSVIANIDYDNNSSGSAFTVQRHASNAATDMFSVYEDNNAFFSPYGTNPGESGGLKIRELATNGINWVGFRAPDALTSDVMFTLPSSAGSGGQVLTSNGSGILNWSTPSTGTVTSVGLSMPTQFTVANSPVTGSGTLATSWNSQTQNFVFAAPSGASGVPTFRALVAADIPITLTGYIQNQVAVDQPAGFRINGNGLFNGGKVGIGTTSPTAILHTVASGAKNANYSGNILTNIATSTTANAIKVGLEVQSSGSWTGNNATNIGLYVSNVSGANPLFNYDAIFNGGGNVGIGTIQPETKLDVQSSSDVTIRAKSSGSGQASFVASKLSSNNTNFFALQTGIDDIWWIGSLGSNDLKIKNAQAGGSEVMTINTYEKMGIGVPPDENKMYVKQSGSVIDGSDFADNTNNAVMGYGFDGTFCFGVTGFTPGTNNYSGGVHGAISTDTWGALGYHSSGSNYGGYFTSTTIGSGFMPNTVLKGIGSASIGNIMGSWSRGELFGSTNMGELYASYNLGNEYTSGVSADIVTNKNERMAAYSVTSNDIKVYSDGKARLVNGSCKVTFDKSYIQLLSQEGNPTITVSALGECEGLYIVSFDKDGFTVKEFHNGQSNVEFTWIAIGKRVDADKVSKLPSAIKDKDFDLNMKSVMFNDNNKDKSANPVWWDGAKLRFDITPAGKKTDKVQGLQK